MRKGCQGFVFFPLSSLSLFVSLSHLPFIPTPQLSSSLPPSLLLSLTLEYEKSWSSGCRNSPVSIIRCKQMNQTLKLALSHWPHGLLGRKMCESAWRAYAVCVCVHTQVCTCCFLCVCICNAPASVWQHLTSVHPDLPSHPSLCPFFLSFSRKQSNLNSLTPEGRSVGTHGKRKNLTAKQRQQTYAHLLLQSQSFTPDPRDAYCIRERGGSVA